MINKFFKKTIVASMTLISVIAINQIVAKASVNYLYAKGENLTSYKFERLSDNVQDNNYYRIKCIKPDGSYAKNEWIDYKYTYLNEGVNDDWIYFGSNGINTEGWFQVGGKWYYGDPSHDDDYIGIDTGMVDGYYLDSDGTLAPQGWYNEGYGNWRYSYGNGKIAKNTTIDGCYINSDGYWKEK